MNLCFGWILELIKDCPESVDWGAPIVLEINPMAITLPVASELLEDNALGFQGGGDYDSIDEDYEDEDDEPLPGEDWEI